MKNQHGNGDKSIDLSIISKYRNEVFGISIISIMIFHFVENVVKSNRTDFISDISKLYNITVSSVGVEMFLFLSGMGLFFSMKKNDNIKQFYSKRFKRILIPYTILGAMFWVIRDVVILHSGGLRFIHDFILISFWTNGRRTFWFISFILIMYLIFPLLFKLLDTKVNHRGITFIILLTATIGGSELIKLFFPDVYNNIEVALCRIPIFLFGIYIGGKIYNHEPFGILEKIIVPFGLAARLMSMTIYYTDIPVKNVFQGRFGTCIFALSLVIMLPIILDKLNCNTLNKILRKVGSYSFELYMTHVAIRNIMNLCDYSTYIIHHYLICIVFSIVLSILLHKLTEKLTQGNKSNKISQ